MTFMFLFLSMFLGITGIGGAIYAFNPKGLGQQMAEIALSALLLSLAILAWPY